MIKIIFINIFKTLKYLFYILIFFLFFAFLIVINSNKVANEIFRYISTIEAIKYEKIDGNIYSGLKIKSFNYDDIIEIDSIYLNINLLPLLLKEIYVKDLKLEKITIKDEFFNYIKSKNKEENSSNDLDFLANLFIKNLELSLYDFYYSNKDEKIDEIFLKVKDIKSDLKDKHSLKFLANIKSKLANISLDGSLENENYKIDSKLDLKKYTNSSFFLKLDGNFQKIDFIVENQEVKDIEDIKIEDSIAKGVFYIDKNRLEISSLKSNIFYEQISSKLDLKGSLDDLDIDKFTFEASLKSNIEKTFLKNFSEDLVLNSRLKGNLKEIKIENIVEKNSIVLENNRINIENSLIDALVKIDSKSLDIKAILNFNADILQKQSKAKTIKSSFDLAIKSQDFKSFDFDLNLLKMDINNIDKLEKISAKFKGFYDENISFISNIFINDSFKIDADFKTDKNNFISNIKNSAFSLNIEKKLDNLVMKSEIKDLKNFGKEISKISFYEPLNLLGLLELNLDIDLKKEKNSIKLEAKSPKISFENESLENINIEAKIEDDIVYFTKLEFIIKKIYDINLEKKFLSKNSYLNTKTFDGVFDFQNIVLKTAKDEKNIILNINTKDFLLNYPNYIKTNLDSNIEIYIKENDKITIKGDLEAKNAEAFYNIQALNIDKDKDIIIISKDKKSIQKDYFLQNISLDLLVFTKNLKYSVKNIDLKADAILNIKKDFNKDIRIYGSVNEVNGTFAELGREYKIADSNIYFRGLESINPILDIKANTKIDDVSINILVLGNLNNPRLQLNSDPTMNQKDILSYLIFGTNFAQDSASSQSVQSQASLFLLNELSRDYAKELGVDMIYFQYDSTNQYIETHIGKNIGEKNRVVLKNKAHGGQIILMRELTKLWNIELGFEEKTQSIDIIYKRRY